LCKAGQPAVKSDTIRIDGSNFRRGLGKKKNALKNCFLLDMRLAKLENYNKLTVLAGSSALLVGKRNCSG